MLSEDRPAIDIWLDDERLAEHFKAVHAKYGNKRDEPDEADMMDNAVEVVMR